MIALMRQVAPFPLEWLKSEWSPVHVWKRGARVIIRSERNPMILPDIREAFFGTLNRIKAGDAEYARQYAYWAAHWARLFLQGKD